MPSQEKTSIAVNARPNHGFAPSSFVVPIGLFLLALIIRCIGLQWGLPTEQRWYSFHPDERDIAAAVVQLDFFTGDFNPNFYNYPSLFIYLTYMAHMLAAMLGLTHQVPANSTAVWPFLYDIILAGRTVTAILGAATVALVYSIGKRAAGTGAGILGALFLAFAPGHVQHSHFATVDVPATFFVTLSLWFCARACTDFDTDDNESSLRRQLKQILLAAGAAGLAAATKYNAGLVLIAPIVVLFQLRRSSTFSTLQVIKYFVTIIAVAIVGFVVGCPGSVLHTREFLGNGQYSGVLYELFVHSRQGSGEIFVGSGNGWWYHLTFNLPFLMTWPLLLISLLGIAYVIAIWRRPLNNRGANETSTIAVNVLLILLVWLTIYFLTTGLSQVRFMRYMLPMLPALCLLAAVGVLRSPLRLPSATSLSSIQRLIAASVLFITMLGTYNVLYSFVVTDPRDEAAAFLKREVTSPTTVGLVEPPWFWSPPLTPQDAPPPRQQALASTSPDGRYRFLFAGWNKTLLRDAAPEWFVVSEFEWTDKERLSNGEYQTFVQALDSSYELVRRFKHQPPATLPGRKFVPHDFLYPNPEVRIYRRRQNSR